MRRKQVQECGSGVAPSSPVRVEATGPLVTSRLTLRPLREGDRDEFFRVMDLTRAALDTWLPLHNPEEDDEALFQRQLRLTEEGERTGGACRRAAFLADGRLAGCFNLVQITRGLHFEADMNWWLASDCTGHGLATEGAQALLDYALADVPQGLGLSRVVAGILPGNAASEAVARRIGFQPVEGVRVSLHAGGSWAHHNLWVAQATLGAIAQVA